MKIVQVTNRYAPALGGIETHVERLSTGLSEMGHDVRVLTHSLDGDAPAHEVRNGVSIERFDRTLAVPHANVSLALGRALRTLDDADIVHVHGYHDTPAALAALVVDRPLIFTPHFHGTSAGRVRALLHRPYRHIGRRIMKRADQVVCVSPAERRLLRRTLGDLGADATVIPNGVDVDDIRTAEPEILRPGGTHVVVAGRLEDYKRVDLVIEAIALLPEHVRLHISGDGPERASLEALVARLDLTHRVTFHGRLERDAFCRLLRAADILVSASLHEAQGITALEGIAAGAAVIVSDIDAHLDHVRSHPGAVSAFPADGGPAALAMAITDLRAPTGSTVVADWNVVARATETLYHRCVATSDSRDGSSTLAV